MNPNDFQFPESLKGFQRGTHELPATAGDFSTAALAGHKKTKVSPSVTVIEPRGGVIEPVSKESYNKASTDLTNMRKSGQAAAYDASVRQFRSKTSSNGKKKETIKIRSGK